MSVVRLIACQLACQPENTFPYTPDMVIDDDRIGKPGPVEVAIDLGRDNGFAGMLGNVEHFESHLGIEVFTIAPRLDGGQAAKLAAVVVDNGAVGEKGIECGGIVVVDRADIGGCRCGHFLRHGFTSLLLVVRCDRNLAEIHIVCLLDTTRERP